MTKEVDSAELNLMLSVVKKYYELGMKQEQIAKEEFVSKSTVCRLIKKAEKSGYVTFKVTINYPQESLRNIEDKFYKYFDLDRVVITSTYTDDLEICLKDTCRLVTSDLIKIAQPDEAICIAWGNTIEKLAEVVSEETSGRKKCSKIVLMNGSTGGGISSLKSSKTIEQFANYFSAEGYMLPVPLIVESKPLADMIKMDSHVSYIMDYAKESQIVVFGIGELTNNSVLRKRGAYTEEEFNTVLSLGAVGNIAGRCYNINGMPVSRQIEERVIALTLDEIRQKEMKIGIAVGKAKADAIIGALNGGMLDRLYIDEMTAQEVLNRLKK